MPLALMDVQIKTIYIKVSRILKTVKIDFKSEH